MARVLMPVPIIHTVGCIQPMLKLLNIAAGSLDQEVIVIHHAAIGIENYPVQLQRALKLLQKPVVVFSATKDPLASVTTRSNMVPCPRKLFAQRPWHNPPFITLHVPAST
jgi:hypothetical protein